VLSFAIDGLRRRFAAEQRKAMAATADASREAHADPTGATDKTEKSATKEVMPDSRELEAAAAAMKALASWHAVETVEQARQACGGQGYLSVNRLPDLRADVDIFTTFEGDNTVLLQLVAKSLLAGFKKRFESGAMLGVARQVMSKAVAAVTEKNIVIVRRTDSEHLRDRGFHLAALRYREERLLETVAARFRKRLTEKKTPAHQAMLDVQEHMVALAQAHADRLALGWFDEAATACTDPELREWLDKLGALHALTLLRRDAAFYAGEGYFDSHKESAMRKETERLMNEIAPAAVGLVDAFGIPDACLAAPIAFMDPAHPRWP
jgi:acyl-CoA oxidase